MKVRNLMMTAIFLVAVSGSFALKAGSKRFIINASYIPAAQDACYEGPVDNDCTIYNHGTQCTTFDASSSTGLPYVPAFEVHPNASFNCVRPLRHMF